MPALSPRFVFAFALLVVVVAVEISLGVGGGDSRFFKSFLLVLTKYLFWQEGVKSSGIA